MEQKRKAVEDATKELKQTAAKELEEATQTAVKAMAALNIPAAERTDYAARL